MSKILIIDNNKDILLAIKANIKTYRPLFHLLTAQSGKEGIKIARAEKPDTILLDIIMPVMDGYEVCKQLKQDKELKYIPIIFLTAFKTDTPDRITGLKLGADAYLAKTVEPGELVAQIDVMLRIKKAEDKLRSDKGYLNKLVEIRTNDLSETNIKLQLEIAERKKAEVALKERMKELRFLYDTTAITGRSGFTLDEICLRSVNQIPLGWQYPEITGGCITIDGKVYKTKNFKETKWMQREDIHVKDLIIGKVEVCYLQEKPDEYEGPFLKEERELIKNFSKQLGKSIMHKQAEKKLISRNKELETWAKVSIDRELFMLNLKKEINTLLEESGEKSKYKIPI